MNARFKRRNGMDFKLLLTTFGMVFLAELGDKTQLATFCFAAENKSRLTVFLGSASALVLTSLLAAVLGCEASKMIPSNYIKMGAGILFIILGLWMVCFPGGK
jgi:putative Ca2+/H+ antiporter (TMEM165/GDT1 family)